MFNWFKKEKVFENPIEISITGINPQTENEFLFYDFVENQYPPHLEKWFEKAKQTGLNLNLNMNMQFNKK